jgi:N-acyl-D-amino-acid deacylase
VLVDRSDPRKSGRELSSFSSRDLSNISSLSAAGIALAFSCAACASVPAGTTITNVRIVDGTGSPARPGSVRIVGDRIEAVGAVAPAPGDALVDGGGLVLAPGFIDTHSHHDRGLERDPLALAVVSQGVTTIVAGQDGEHPMPLASTLAELEREPPAINVAFYAGHGSLRAAVMGEDFRRPATPAEIEAMARLLGRELAAGALGLSSGLEYDPGIYSERAELVALAKVASAAGGRYISHVRSEDRWFWEAIDEILAIGREARLPVQISHMKLAMTSLWGQSTRLLALLDQARAQGIDVTADAYPYTYWQSTLQVLFPKRDFEDRAEAEKVLREIAPPDGLRLTSFAPEPSYAGKTVAELALLRGEDPASTLMGLIRESLAWSREHPEAEEVESVVGTSMTEEDVAALLAWDHTNVCSDGELDGSHPRGFGAFPRVLARLVRERGTFALETAVAKMSRLAAEHVGLRGRGTIAPGCYADLVLFDPARVNDEATVAEPHRVATGIVEVWVNGRSVWRGGRVTGERPGRVLRRGSG